MKSSNIYNHPNELSTEEATFLIKTAGIDLWLFKPKYFYAITKEHNLQRLYFDKSKEFLQKRKFSFYILTNLFDGVYEDFLDEFSFACYVPCFNQLKNDSRKEYWIKTLQKTFPKCNFTHIID